MVNKCEDLDDFDAHEGHKCDSETLRNCEYCNFEGCDDCWGVVPREDLGVSACQTCYLKEMETKE